MDRDQKREDIQRAHLAAAGLPPDYQSLNSDARYEARAAVLRGWYDPEKPNIFCTDQEMMLQALYLWVEWYMKPAKCNKGTYFHRDPKHKYEMVRFCVAPPLVDTEPAKNVFHAPRGSTKTQTMIQQFALMAVVCRPYTELLISELNAPRTSEEMKKIRQQVQDNELIASDFGGEGQLFKPNARDGNSWNDRQLDFIHQPNCRLMGYSVKSAQRGRHPIGGFIDDPENKETIRNPELRREYFEWLFGTYLPMVQRGGFCSWFGTVADPNSCLSIALEGMDAQLSEDGEMETRETRMQDWRKKRFELVFQNDDGDLESLFPDYITVEAFEEKKRTLGLARAMAEFQGIGMRSSDLAFDRDMFRHGWMKCRDKGGVPYMLDMKTGSTKSWDGFLDGLYIVGACDLSNSEASWSDYGAVIILGIDELRTHYVLDVFLQKIHADRLVRKAFAMAGDYGAGRLSFDSASMQNYIVQDAQRYARLIDSQGKRPPTVIPFKGNRGTESKNDRILGLLRPLFRNDRIRIPHYDTVTTPDGKEHVPYSNTGAKYVSILKDQIDLYTDEGPGSHDDGPDALTMAIRIAGNRRGIMVEKDDPNEVEYEAWKDVGVDINWAAVPPEAWPREIVEEHLLQRRMASYELGRDTVDDVDPYEICT